MDDTRFSDGALISTGGPNTIIDDEKIQQNISEIGSLTIAFTQQYGPESEDSYIQITISSKPVRISKETGSSCLLIVGVEDGRIVLQEIFRFEPYVKRILLVYNRIRFAFYTIY